MLSFKNHLCPRPAVRLLFALHLLAATAAGPALAAVSTGLHRDVPPQSDSATDPASRRQLRDLSTDRPDKTESPYTVDAGHFQFEMDVASYTRDHDESDGNDLHGTAWAIAPINIKFGLRENADLQVVLESYNRVRVEDRASGGVARASGFGDITTRLKVNLWGNDGGKTAFAVMPFVKLPTNENDLGNDSIEGGVILPLAVELSGGWGMGLMAEVDIVRNAADDGYTTVLINSLTFARDLTDRLGGYVEFFSEIGSESGSRWIATFDCGLTYAITSDLQLDAGINLGVTDAADDVNPFLGVSWRY